MSRKKRRQNVPTEFHAATEAEALFLEQAQAYFRDVQDVANKAPDGKVIDQVEAAILLKSRQLVRQSMESVFGDVTTNVFPAGSVGGAGVAEAGDHGGVRGDREEGSFSQALGAMDPAFAYREHVGGFRSGGRGPRHLGRSGVGVRQGSGMLGRVSCRNI